MSIKNLIIIPFLLSLNTWAFAQVQVSKRTGFLKNYPCSECHNNISDADKSGKLPVSHSMVGFEHAEAMKCNNCHSTEKMDQLKLISGEYVSFDKSYLVCGQCHGERKRDWSRGIHGKQVGSWNGNKTRYNCTDCHDPHKPKYPGDKPLKSPKFPKFGIRKDSHH